MLKLLFNFEQSMKAQSTTLAKMFLYPLQLFKCSYFRYFFENILIRRVFCGLWKHAKAQNSYCKIEENCQFLPVCILLETYNQNKNITYFSVTFTEKPYVITIHLYSDPCAKGNALFLGNYSYSAAMPVLREPSTQLKKM